MTDAVLIQPVTHHLESCGLDVLEIELGGTPRGLVVLLGEPGLTEVDLVEAMNTVAVEGYESLAASAEESTLPAVLERAAERGWGPEQIGVVGFGAGGTLVLDLARSRQLGAAISISPSAGAAGLADDGVDAALRTPWLGMLGELDDALDTAQVSRLRERLRAGSDVFSQVVVYPGVGADFHRRSETGIGFSASYDGWQRAVEWLNARVASRLTPLAIAWRQREAAR